MHAIACEFIVRILSIALVKSNMVALFQKVPEAGLAVWLAFAAVLIITLSASWLLVRGPWRAWRFLSRYHHDGTLLGYAKSFPLLCEAILRAGKSVTIFEAALMQTEIDILIPPEKAPSRFEAGTDYKKALDKWRTKEKNRIQNRKETFDNLIRWKGKEKERLRASEATLRTWSNKERESTRPIITIGNPAEIDNNRDKIARYFKVAKTLPNFQDEFQSFVQMTDGFFAPIYLVSGLMSRFDEDWSPVINNYRKQLENVTNNTSRELMELQSFEFNCWLLWGPSIPLCNCEQWRTEAGRTNQRIDSLFYQYGFGDENNSIDVLIENGRSPHFRNLVSEWLIQPIERGADASSSVPRIVAATPRSLLGKINYGPSINKEKLCKAQSAIGNEKAKASRLYLALDETQIKLGMHSTPDEIDIKSGPRGSQYYSAYIWVMFVVCNQKGEPIYTGRNERWRNLLPFFEHGNIADATTMQSLKENLAAKVVNALKEIMTRPLDQKRGIRIRYACAFDDPNCSDKEGILFPHGERISMAAQTPLLLDAANDLRPTRIVSLLEKWARWDLILIRAIASGSLILEEDGAAWPYKDDYSHATFRR
jgi:hypothetical protein